MSASRDLIKHIEAINAKSREWVAEDPENRVAGELVTLPEHWADYDVYTPEEFDRYQMEEDYSALYKEEHGTSPRIFWDDYSDEEVKAMVQKLLDNAEAELEDQRDWMAEEAEEQAEIDTLLEGDEYDEIQEDFDKILKVKDIFH